MFKKQNILHEGWNIAGLSLAALFPASQRMWGSLASSLGLPGITQSQVPGWGGWMQGAQFLPKY